MEIFCSDRPTIAQSERAAAMRFGEEKRIGCPAIDDAASARGKSRSKTAAIAAERTPQRTRYDTK